MNTSFAFFHANYSKYLSHSHVLAIRQFVWTYILPSICFIGLFTNATNIIVFAQTKTLKNKIYRYFLSHSIADFIYIALCLARFAIKLSDKLHYSYWGQIFELIAYRYLTGALPLFMIFLELTIATKRLLMILNINLTIKLKVKTNVFIFGTISLILLLPLAFSTRIVDQNSCKFTYFLSKCSNHSSSVFALTEENVPYVTFLKRTYSVVFSFRGLVAPLVLLLVNIGIIIKFRQHCRKKSILTRSSTRFDLLNKGKHYFF